MKKTGTLLVCFIVTISMFSQQRFNYKKESLKKAANFYDIVDKKLNEITSYDLVKVNNVKEVKHFKRWYNFWKDRVNEDGSFPNSNLGFYNAGLLDSQGLLVNNAKVKTYRALDKMKKNMS